MLNYLTSTDQCSVLYEEPLPNWQIVKVAIKRGDRLYLVADSANASANSQLALTRVNWCVDIPSPRCRSLDQSI